MLADREVTLMDLSLLVLVVLIALSTGGLVRVLWLRRRRAEDGSTLWSLVESAIGIFLVVGMLYAAAAQVIVRYLLSDYLTLAWTEELSRLLLVWAAFWGAAIVQRSDDHISMAIVFDLLPANIQLAVRLLGDLAVLTFLGVAVWYGWRTAQSVLAVPTVTLGLPVAVFAAAVPVTGVLMIGSTINLMILRIRRQPIRSQVQEV
ncbi:MAG: TRAP transporter small permease [Chloroflexi bacterium]|nr:TRAP transporter small permease [Chloroflexota bacterium]